MISTMEIIDAVREGSKAKKIVLPSNLNYTWGYQLIEDLKYEIQYPYKFIFIYIEYRDNVINNIKFPPHCRLTRKSCSFFFIVSPVRCRICPGSKFIRFWPNLCRKVFSNRVARCKGRTQLLAFRFFTSECFFLFGDLGFQYRLQPSLDDQTVSNVEFHMGIVGYFCCFYFFLLLTQLFGVRAFSFIDITDLISGVQRGELMGYQISPNSHCPTHTRLHVISHI